MAAELAECGAGVALVHCHAARNALGRGTLVDMNLGQIEAKEGYHVARKTGALPDLQDRFVEWLTSVVRTKAASSS